MDIAIENTRYLNLGEWINFSTYAEYDGKKIELKVWGKDSELPYQGIKE